MGREQVREEQEGLHEPETKKTPSPAANFLILRGRCKSRVISHFVANFVVELCRNGTFFDKVSDDVFRQRQQHSSFAISS